MSRWKEAGKVFADLVEAVLKVEGDFRLRFGSVEPEGIDSRLIGLMTHPKITPHLHLCLQSGSERILLAMKRGYTAAVFMELCEKLRSAVPRFNITTDAIVGFPGESDNDFRDTLEVCRHVGFGHIHTFPYSRRRGTLADRMSGQVEQPVKKYRAEQLRALSVETKRTYRRGLLDSVVTVLAESAESETGGTLRVRGLSEPYVPVSFQVKVPQASEVKNRMWKVRLEELAAGDDPDLIGRPAGRPGPDRPVY
jgi:threonylcarbamoyladenosine tRNA methylthiotransferase MtaB